MEPGRRVVVLAMTMSRNLNRDGLGARSQALLDARARNDIRFAIRLARLRATGGKIEVLDWANMFRFTDGDGRESLVMMRDDDSQASRNDYW